MLLGLRVEGSVSDRETLFFAARVLLEGLATEQPTMLVFEDIHWADPSLLDLIEFLAARIRDVPLMILALTRPELLSHRPAWAGGLPASMALHLDPLAAGDALELTTRLLAQHGLGVPTGQATTLAETAEGNPLFIEELAVSLVERVSAEPGKMPTSIREILSARIDALPPQERSVILDASVVGKVFWRGVLARLQPEREADLGQILGSLEQRDLVRREAVSRIQGEQQFVFKHVMIRDVAYQTLPRPERRQRHAAVAAFLEQATPDLGDAAAALAHHWREAGEHSRAVGYLVTAGEQAGRGWAKQEALDLYRQALDLVPEDATDLRRDLVRRVAVAAQQVWHAFDARQLQERGKDPA
jgi:predicted ATPase